MKIAIEKARGWPLAAGVVLLATAVLLHRPLIQGAGWTHSYVFNSVWILEFSEALKQGQFPPRWLHGGFNGLGSSSFYYYPPLAFYVTSMTRAVLGPNADHSHIAAWAAYVMTAASGLTMFGWLREKTGEGRAGLGWALAGALAYVFAPYHQIDYFVRGAMGETAAYATVPFLMLALERAAGSRRWIPGLAIAYAGLLVSHPAIAMLVSVGIIPFFAGSLILKAPSDQRRAVAMRGAAGALLGVAIAASYIGPALFMQRYASLQWMFGAGPGDPYNWTLLRPDLWPERPFASAMAWLGWGTGAVALAAIAAVAGKGFRQADQRLKDAVLWGAIALFGLTLYALPWVWHGPTGLLLGKAQFAYRLLLGMEFAAITAAVLAAASGRWRKLLVPVPVCLLMLSHGYGLLGDDIAKHLIHNGDLSGEINQMIVTGRTPQEHLPAGVDIASPRFADSASMSGFDDTPPARPLDPGARVTRTGVMPDGTMIVMLDAPRPTAVVLRRFYYPTWRAYRVQDGRDPEIPVQAFGRERLLSFRADAGVHAYRIRIERSPLEKACDALSLLAILVALALLVPSVMEGLKKIRKAAI